MIEANSRRKFKLIRLKDVYYASQVQGEHSGYDAIYYFNCQHSSKKAKEFKTMLIDLSREPKEILASFCKKTRAQVKKGLSDNRLTFNICEYPTAQDLENYCSAYDYFAKQKQILRSHKGLLNILNSENMLIIATVLIDNEKLCQFALIDLEDKMVCYHGYNTRFSFLDNAEKVKLISQANRALEYYCMIYAKESGKKYYDLCGLTLDPDNILTSNVDHYKKGFKGEVITEYNFIKPVTAVGMAFCFFVHLKRDCGYIFQVARHTLRQYIYKTR